MQVHLKLVETYQCGSVTVLKFIACYYCRKDNHGSWSQVWAHSWAGLWASQYQQWAAIQHLGLVDKKVKPHTEGVMELCSSTVSTDLDDSCQSLVVTWSVLLLAWCCDNTLPCQMLSQDYPHGVSIASFYDVTLFAFNV